MNLTFRDSDGVTIHDDDSPHLLEVATKINQVRDRASGTRRNYSDELKAVQNDPHLSEQGKRERTAELEADRKAQRRAGLAAENEIIDNKIAELERRLDGFVGYSESSIIAYRDAQDRADAVDSADRAATLMTRALRSNDRTLAHALFRVAIEKRYPEAQKAFARENPTVAALANDVQKLRDLRSSFGRALAHM